MCLKLHWQYCFHHINSRWQRWYLRRVWLCSWGNGSWCACLNDIRRGHHHIKLTCGRHRCNQSTMKSKTAQHFTEDWLDSLNFLSAYPTRIQGKVAGACPSWNWTTGRDKLPAQHRANTKSQATISTHMHTYDWFRITDWPNVHVIKLWEESREKPHLAQR